MGMFKARKTFLGLATRTEVNGHNPKMLSSSLSLLCSCFPNSLSLNDADHFELMFILCFSFDCGSLSKLSTEFKEHFTTKIIFQ